MVELSSYLKPVQVPQTSTDQYHESSLSPVNNLTRPCVCVCACVCVRVRVCVLSARESERDRQSTGCPLDQRDTPECHESLGNPAYFLRWVNGNSFHTLRTHLKLVLIRPKNGWGFTQIQKKKKKKKKKKQTPNKIIVSSIQNHRNKKQKQIITLQDIYHIRTTTQ